MKHRCKMCNYTWNGRKTRTGNLPKQCPHCHSTVWQTGERRIRETAKRLIKKHSKSLDILAQEEVQETMNYEDATNQGGYEWHACMFFDDTKEIVEVCSEWGYNVATIEVPLATVDVSWREKPYALWQTRPAAHPSERGCYMTMPLVLCAAHTTILMERVSCQQRTCPTSLST